MAIVPPPNFEIEFDRVAQIVLLAPQTWKYTYCKVFVQSLPPCPFTVG